MLKTKMTALFSAYLKSSCFAEIKQDFMFVLSILTILFQVLVLFLKKKKKTIKGQKQLPKLDLIHIKLTENEYKKNMIFRLQFSFKPSP